MINYDKSYRVGINLTALKLFIAFINFLIYTLKYFKLLIHFVDFLFILETDLTHRLSLLRELILNLWDYLFFHAKLLLKLWDFPQLLWLTVFLFRIECWNCILNSNSCWKLWILPVIMSYWFLSLVKIYIFFNIFFKVWNHIFSFLVLSLQFFKHFDLLAEIYIHLENEMLIVIILGKKFFNCRLLSLKIVWKVL